MSERMSDPGRELSPRFGKDALGPFKRLKDGRALRVEKRWFNSLLMLSASVEDQGYSDGW